MRLYSFGICTLFHFFNFSHHLKWLCEITLQLYIFIIYIHNRKDKGHRSKKRFTSKICFFEVTIIWQEVLNNFLFIVEGKGWEGRGEKETNQAANEENLMYVAFEYNFLINWNKRVVWTTKIKYLFFNVIQNPALNQKCHGPRIKIRLKNICVKKKSKLS